MYNIQCFQNMFNLKCNLTVGLGDIGRHNCNWRETIDVAQNMNKSKNCQNMWLHIGALGK